MLKIILFIIVNITIMSLSIADNLPKRGFKILITQNKQSKIINLYQESHALVIGVSNYTNGWPNLPGVKTDIKEVSKALQKNGFHVVKILNPNAQQLDNAFRHFITKYGNKEQSRLLFYFAGHGYTVKPKWGGNSSGYIVPSDAPDPRENLSMFRNKALKMRKIEGYALDIDAKHALFLFDSCFSGSLFTTTRAIPENINYNTTNYVRQFITAGTDKEKVPDISIFRQQFIAALSGEGDKNQDGYLTGTELGEFIQVNVINYSKGAQHPQYGKIINQYLDKGDFVFKVKRNPILITSSEVSIDNSQENNFWNTLNKTEIEELQAYLEKYPQGLYAELAEIKLKRLQKIKNQTLLIPVKEKAALLILHSNVYHNKVWINAENKGSTPLALNLKIGNYHIEMKKNGFKPYSRMVHLKAGKNQLVINLHPLNQGKRIGKYIVYANNTVKDTKTGLIWKRCAEGLSGINCSIGHAKTYTWYDARKFKNIRYANYLNWRLPTIKELNTLSYCNNGYLIKYEQDGYDDTGNCGTGGKNNYQKPTINQQIFPNASPNASIDNWQSYIYWSASPYIKDSSYAWVLHFLNGNDNAYKRSSKYFVRLVQVEK